MIIVLARKYKIKERENKIFVMDINDINIYKDRSEIDEILKKTEEKIRNGELRSIPFEQFKKEQMEKRIKFYILSNTNFEMKE